MPLSIDNRYIEKSKIVYKTMILNNFSKWFAKLKVGQKISFGYAINLGLVIVGTTSGLGVMHYYQHQAQSIEEDALEEYQLLTRLQTDLL